MKVLISFLSGRCTARLWLLALCLPFHGLASAGETVSLLPVPLNVQYLEGAYAIPKSVVIAVPDDKKLKASAEWIAELIEKHSGRSVGVSTGVYEGTSVSVERIPPAELQAQFEAANLAPGADLTEGYSLQVGSAGVLIQAADNAGLFYGLTTLWQLLAYQSGPPGQLPSLKILDVPKFEWRGLMLDSARHMQSPKFIMQYIDWMSLHKLNVFHWHLTDDQAWRLEIKLYPKLTSVGGFRVPAGDAPAADIDSTTGKSRLYGGYYTQDEIREVVAHAASRNMIVVPEIDVPGHATAAIAAYPELGVEGHGIDRVPASWGIFHNVFNLEESTMQFLENVLSEVVELFPGPFVHLGGDEVETGQWEHSERTRARMAELGIEDVQSLQNYYVERLQSFLDRYDRRVIGWDEILKSELPPHAVIMSWRGTQGAIEAAAKGHQTVLSPAPTLYLDHIQTTAADTPPGRGGVITTRDIYEFDPLPDSLTGNSDLLLGLQANIWTEHIRTEERVAYMTWPRAAAVAELGWSTPGNRSWDSFAQRLPVAVTRMQALGIPAATDKHALYGQALPGPSDPDRREDRELKLCDQAIVLALEDDAPIDGERESFLVDIQHPCWIWEGVKLDALTGISASVGQLPFNFEIGESIHHVVVEKPATGEGDLRVRLACDGPVIADLPLAPALDNHGVTTLSATAVTLPENAPATGELCFSFTREGVEPIWVIDWVELVREKR